jgi:uncharacterized protein
LLLILLDRFIFTSVLYSKEYHILRMSASLDGCRFELRYSRVMFEPFSDIAGEVAVRGYLHLPEKPNGDAFLLTHGAGADCRSKLLVDMADALATAGFAVLRFDLPFRQERPHGPPSFGSASRDRDGIRRAIAVMKQKFGGRIFLGGHSYGGRQATMLIAEEPQLIDALLLLSYPLHPPRKPAQLRTSHFPKIATPAFFVHGTRDPFGSIPEMQSALQLLPSPHALLQIEGAGHDLRPKEDSNALLAHMVRDFQAFLSSLAAASSA